MLPFYSGKIKTEQVRMDYLQWAIPMALKQGRSKAGDGRPEWWLENCGDSCLFTALPFTCMGMRNRDLKDIKILKRKYILLKYKFS